ncbi:MAG: ECF transporter S component [Clostridia bacterium]|nr:ECF transporter S component [Clostridia bacterium]
MKENKTAGAQGKKALIDLVLSAFFMALGMVLPFLTGQIPAIGNMLLPMHVPVFLCALICGWQYGTAVGFILPLLRCAVFGMPIFYPNAIGMAFELAAYAFVSGFLYGRSRWKCLLSLYRSLVTAMLAGRAVWGVAQVVLLGIKGNRFTLAAFIAGGFTNALPGIILQLILIPAVMLLLRRTGLMKLHRRVRTKGETSHD